LSQQILRLSKVALCCSALLHATTVLLLLMSDNIKRYNVWGGSEFEGAHVKFNEICLLIQTLPGMELDYCTIRYLAL